MPAYLTDTSIWSWANNGLRPDIAEKLAERLERDEVATCYPIVIEYLHRARSATEYETLYADLFEPVQWAEVNRGVVLRAFDVQRAMASSKDGNHRRPAVDFLVAAAAELADGDIAIWAFDRDLRVICEHTGQPHEIEAAD